MGSWMMFDVSTTPPPTSLAEVRERIDAIDSDLVRLLAQRQSLVRAAASFKADDQAVRAPDRVAQVIASVRDRAVSSGLDPAVAEAVWRAMIAAFIEVELAEHKHANPKA
ncbi:chorismate mutase [Saccharothrix sp. S26]|uniref:chorismate mutase n=1 Tax=Saccharothrix sp. S26 TaxID=2907215 RepID=UPI001F189362|nr:chorismate mutase [Saccharothrix sp. S26]MCE6994736.1 chorismate mutase [Saccharothrix sp. S26]